MTSNNLNKVINVALKKDGDPKQKTENLSQPEVMHCTRKIVASIVVAFHFLWHLQDIKQHKSAKHNSISIS